MQRLNQVTRRHPVTMPLADDTGTTMFDALAVLVVLAVAVIGLALAG